ncbi:maleylpyruvate isomerase [Saccharomonospora amisosensis]|uniref:Maleylpyruvate isomerase n=1 Tax=Saccharomonospora amisosensis TaxID=1128677 RepID=A0A7X5UQR5_9PSEU|nr:maleylpyruvate isomerase family mycothiol-dependent enzyme [Saccharomonospora amisosensis]NIJ12455.1 maleylpyruvate isomerase [Saccharomonospora amisosensis]
MSTRQWMDRGTELLLSAVKELSDTDFAAPSALPGWSRAHVVAHVHFNAEALRRLVGWARTGVPAQMYPSRQHRDEEIESGARLPAARLRELVGESAAALAREYDELTAEGLERQVRTAQGNLVPASALPWMRTREVVVHAVDLDTGADFSGLPDDLVRALLVDVLDRRIAAGEGPALARWLTGRADTAPELGPWL